MAEEGFTRGGPLNTEFDPVHQITGKPLNSMFALNSQSLLVERRANTAAVKYIKRGARRGNLGDKRVGGAEDLPEVRTENLKIKLFDLGIWPFRAAESGTAAGPRLKRRGP